MRRACLYQRYVCAFIRSNYDPFRQVSLQEEAGLFPGILQHSSMSVYREAILAQVIGLDVRHIAVYKISNSAITGFLSLLASSS
jgi:hypothetical protein